MFSRHGVCSVFEAEFALHLLGKPFQVRKNDRFSNAMAQNRFSHTWQCVFWKNQSGQTAPRKYILVVYFFHRDSILPEYCEHTSLRHYSGTVVGAVKCYRVNMHLVKFRERLMTSSL